MIIFTLVVLLICSWLVWRIYNDKSSGLSYREKRRRKKLGLCNHEWIRVYNDEDTSNIILSAWYSLTAQEQSVINEANYAYDSMPNVSKNLAYYRNHLNYVCQICGQCHHGNSMYRRFLIKNMKRDAKLKIINKQMWIENCSK